MLMDRIFKTWLGLNPLIEGSTNFKDPEWPGSEMKNKSC